MPCSDEKFGLVFQWLLLVRGVAAITFVKHEEKSGFQHVPSEFHDIVDVLEALKEVKDATFTCQLR